MDLWTPWHLVLKNVLLPHLFYDPVSLRALASCSKDCNAIYKDWAHEVNYQSFVTKVRRLQRWWRLQLYSSHLVPTTNGSLLRLNELPSPPPVPLVSIHNNAKSYLLANMNQNFLSRYASNMSCRLPKGYSPSSDTVRFTLHRLADIVRSIHVRHLEGKPHILGYKILVGTHIIVHRKFHNARSEFSCHLPLPLLAAVFQEFNLDVHVNNSIADAEDVVQVDLYLAFLPHQYRLRYNNTNFNTYSQRKSVAPSQVQAPRSMLEINQVIYELGVYIGNQ